MDSIPYQLSLLNGGILFTIFQEFINPVAMKTKLLSMMLLLSYSVALFAQSSETREVFGHEPKHLPCYEGGYEKMYEFIFSNIDMSDIDSSTFDGRRIFVGFTIDTLGNTYDHRILKGSVSKRSDDALINACKLLHFHPAIGYDDKPQNYEFSIAIQFGHEQNDRNKCFLKRIFKKKSR